MDLLQSQSSVQILGVAVAVAAAGIAAAYLYLSSKRPKGCLDPENFRDFKLVERRQLSHNVAKFRFGLPTPTSVLGLPIGQHISCRGKDSIGEEVVKPYTPTTLDSDVGYFELVIKMYPQGRMSHHFREMKAGDYLSVKGPKGDPSGTSIISLGKEFETDDEAYNFYNSYARNRGFGVRKKGIEKSRTPPHEVICRKYCCNKEGVKRIVDNRQDGYAVNRRIDTRVNCPAELHIRLRILPDRSFWVVTKFVDLHSHELSSPDKVHHHFSHQSHRSKISRSIMTNLDDVGLRPSNIARVVNAMNLVEDSEQVSAQQCIDYIRHKSKNIGQEFFSIIKYFQEKAESDPEFFFATEVDQSGTLRSVFWADGRARSSYLVFSDVVVFDTTYRTNHLNLPFAPFTGLNHHQQSILFGCALLADEQRDTFVWLFKKWLKCMHGVAPHSIITDQDAQIGDAIKIVLPNARHRFCFWHIRKHIAEHQIPLMNRFGDDFPTDFNLWFSSRDITTCEERWRLMKEKYDIDEEEDSWLLKMYRLRSHWVDAYLKDIFWAGMTTSQRSESINSFFDGYVNANTKLLEFVNQYDKTVAARRRAESQEDFMCLNCVPSCTSNPYEIQVSKIYTRKIFKLFQSEWAVVMSLFSEELKTEGQRIIYLVGDYSEPKDKWYQVSYDFCGELHVFCSCAMFETHGILCRHILCILWRKQITYIPESYILKRWRLDARQRNSVEEYGMKILPKLGNPEFPSTVRLWSLRSKFNANLEMVSDSDLYLSKLDVLLQGFQIEASNDFKTKSSNDQSSQSENNVGSSSSLLVLRDGDQITIRDPLGLVATKGRPRSASRIKSGFEESLSQKEVKHRKCENCQQLGHYRTGCPLLGRFKYQPGQVTAFGMLAGGSGITPMFQVARAILENPNDKTNVHLIYANVTFEDILLKEELDGLVSNYPGRFQVYYVLNQPPAVWNGGIGFVSKEMIQTHCPAPASDIQILRCGPPPMNKAMAAHLEELGYTKEMQFQF